MAYCIQGFSWTLSGFTAMDPSLWMVELVVIIRGAHKLVWTPEIKTRILGAILVWDLLHLECTRIKPHRNVFYLPGLKIRDSTTIFFFQIVM